MSNDLFVGRRGYQIGGVQKWELWCKNMSGNHLISDRIYAHTGAIITTAIQTD